MSQPARQQPRPPAQEDWGIAVPFFAGAMVIAVVGFWPAMVWHGYTDTGGWRWDIHSTVAELVYLGVVAFIITLAWLGSRPARTAAPPKCVPPRPGPDPAVTMRLLEELDEIDGYAAEAENARTGEDLDYLNVYGRLPGRERRGPR